jgi:Bifunctional DNA primase/polymerase, N-terminal
MFPSAIQRGTVECAATARLPVNEQANIPTGLILDPYGRFYPLNREKRPLIRCFKKDPAKYADTHKFEYWSKNPELAGWGLRIDSPLLVVFDCEHPNKKGPDNPGPDGLSSFASFWQTHTSSLPEHLTVRSASGGLHHYFLLPPDLVPEGKYLQGGNSFLPGVDLQTSSRNIIQPSSVVAAGLGSGCYEIVSGPAAGIVEMPRDLALALIGMRKFVPIQERGKAKKDRSGTSKAGKPVGARHIGPPAAEAAPDLPSEAEVDAQVSRMLAGNKYFPRLWRYEPADGYDPTLSAFLFNIAKVAAGFGCDEPMARAVCLLFCQVHGEPFNYQAWAHTWRKARAHKKEREGRSDNSQVHNYPPDSGARPSKKDAMLGQWLAIPRCPDLVKQDAFNTNAKARASFGGKRTDFDGKHSDDPVTRQWKRTRSYLISLAYHALKADCDQHEVLWYLVQFVRMHSPRFYLTPKRVQTITEMAKGRRKAILRRAEAKPEARLALPKKSRKRRSDSGTGKRLKQVAALMCNGLGYVRIAESIGLQQSTVRDYCRQVKARGGPDQILGRKCRPLPTAIDSSLAQLLYQKCRARDQPIQMRTAVSVVREATTYSEQLQMRADLTEEMICSAVRRAVNLKRKRLLDAFLYSLANLACDRDPTVRLLAKKIQLEGLPVGRVFANNGRPQRVFTRFPKAVLRAKEAMAALRMWIAVPTEQENVEEIWKYAQQYGSLKAAVEQSGRERAERWCAMNCKENPGSSNALDFDDPDRKPLLKAA